MGDTRTRLWIALFVLVVFVAGLGTGVVVTPWLGGGAGPRGDLGPPRGPGERPPRPGMTDRLLERLSTRTDLTDEQTTRLDALFDTRRDRFRALSRDMRDRFETERETFRRAIAEILTPEQMAIFESEIVRMGEERRRWRGGRDGGSERGRPPDR